MENKMLNIKWDTGCMNINMPAFFPCSVTKYKQLLEIIKLDWEHEEQLMQTMRDFFQAKVQDEQFRYEEHCKEYGYYYQKEADMRHILEDGKYPNGIPLTKKQIKNTKEYMRDYAIDKRAAERSAKQAKKNKEWYERYASLYNQ